LEHITLSTLNKRIRQATKSAFPEALWVVAEILEMSVNRSGHCYLELIEKSASDEKIVAKSRATIWSSRFSMIRPYFETTTGSRLETGIKVLVRAEVSFHAIYGLSLNIMDIDPSFTMGDLARRKKEVLEKLDSAGVLEMNHELELAEVPQNIAVVSSETAAGFGDFMDSLVNNGYGFGFHVTLFPAIVQGDAAEKSIISAFEQVFAEESSFDALVLIRGGGSQSDLDCFNGYELAMNIAQFPIPVLTGIGHERDETIADIVAYMSLKTPTAVAEFLVDRVLAFLERIGRLQDRFSQALRLIITNERMALQQKTSDLDRHVGRYITREEHLLSDYRNSMRSELRHILSERNATLSDRSGKVKYLWKRLAEEKHRDLAQLAGNKVRLARELLRSENEKLEHARRTLEMLRPESVLKRGYSITRLDGRVVTSAARVRKGDVIESHLADGVIRSNVESGKQNDHQ